MIIEVGKDNRPGGIECQKILRGPSTLGLGYRFWGVVASGCIPKRMSLIIVSISFDCLDLSVLRRT